MAHHFRGLDLLKIILFCIFSGVAVSVMSADHTNLASLGKSALTGAVIGIIGLFINPKKKMKEFTDFVHSFDEPEKQKDEDNENESNTSGTSGKSEG